MKKPKKYKSISNWFAKTYTISLISILLIIVLIEWITQDDISDVLPLLVIFIPLLFLGLFFRTYYIIRGGKILQYTIGGKDESPYYELMIESIERIEVVSKEGQMNQLKIYKEGLDSAELHIEVQEVENFLKTILDQNDNIRVTN